MSRRWDFTATNITTAPSKHRARLIIEALEQAYQFGQDDMRALLRDLLDAPSKEDVERKQDRE